MLSDERRASLRHPIRAALRRSARRSRPTSSPPIPRWGGPAPGPREIPQGSAPTPPPYSTSVAFSTWSPDSCEEL